jgi:hypothetical protein
MILLNSIFFMLSVSDGVGRFVAVVMVVEIRDTTGSFGIFEALVSCSQFCYVILCMLGENSG